MSAVIKARTTTTPKLYLDFFKSYYREKTRALRVVTTIIGAAAVIIGLIGGAEHWNIFACAVPIAAGAMLIVYPHFVYKRPYNSVKNNKITTSFEFYDDRMIETGDSSRDEYEYSALEQVWETKDYFYIYHSKENASVVDKSGIIGASADELRSFLKEKVPFKIK